MSSGARGRNADEPARDVAIDRREALYEAIEEAQRFLRGQEAAEAFMEDVRLSYPAPQYFLEAPRSTLMTSGLSGTDAFYYALIPSLTRTVLSQQRGLNPRLDALSRMAPYLKTLYVGVHVECFYLILLNGRGQLIRPVLLQKGAVDAAPFYLRQVLMATLQEEARYIVLAHNHPGGTLRPSREDLLCTLRALNAMAPLGVPLLDHIIVAGDRIVSIRQTGMLQELLWTAAMPTGRIVRGWLDVDTMANDTLTL